jgi:hypothetical protein
MTIPIAVSPLIEYRPIAVFFVYIRQVSDKTLIMVRFIALAETHLRRQRSAYQVASFVRQLCTTFPSSIYLTTCQADTLKSHIQPGIYSDLAYKLQFLFLFGRRTSYIRWSDVSFNSPSALLQFTASSS